MAGVAAVVALLFYGAWTVRPNPPEPAEATAESAAADTASTAEGQAATADAGGTEPAVEATAEAGAADATASEGTASEGTEAADAAAAGTDAGAAGTGDAADAGADSAATDAAAGDAAAATEATAGDDAAAAGTDAAATTGEAATAEAAAAPAIAPPEFDLVRVDRDGLGLVAGSAAPAATVSLRINGAELISVPADGQGKFVAMFNLPPSEAPRMLGMVMVLADGTEVKSTQTVAIAPTLAPAAEAVAEAGSASTDAAATTTATATEPVAPAALLVTDEGAKILQAPESLPDVALNVTVDSISYSPEGEVQLAGRGTAGAVVRIYLDNTQVGDGLIAEGGDWSLTVPDIAPGIYTLRVDQLDAAGKVTSRFETPFKRETPEALAAAAEAAGQAAGTAAADAGTTAAAGDAAATQAAPVTVTVQPGFTLWAIARDNLGEGVMYVQVFEANKSQIKDPDLIYPGQVFTIPKP